MSNCQWAKDNIKAYVDGQLDLSDRLMMRLHLAKCASCMEEKRAMENTGKDLKSGTPGPLDPGLRAKLLANIPDSPVAGPSTPKPRFSLPKWETLSKRQRLEIWGVGAAFSLLYVVIVPVFGPARERAMQLGRPTFKAVGHAMQQYGQDYDAQNAEANVTYADGHVPAHHRIASRQRQVSDSSRASASAQDVDSTFSTAGGNMKQETNRPDAAAANEYSNRGAAGSVGSPVSRWASQSSSALAHRTIPSRATAGTTANKLSAREQLDQLSLAERKVHKTGDITVEVAKVEKESEAVANLITSAGGYVAQNELTTGEDNLKTASLTTKVPVAQFDTVVAQIARLGNVKAKSITGEDITEKMSDEQEAEHVLQNDITETRNKLNGRETRGQRTEDARTLRELRIRNAQSAARLTLLKRLSVMADITVQLNEKPVNTVEQPKQSGFWNDMSGTAQDAAHSFVQAMKLPILLLVWLLVYAPVWMLLLLGYRYAVRR